jgi:hypothetical protein
VAGNTAYHFFEIVIETTTSVKFYIDGTLEATHTTNIPTSAQHLKFYITNAEAASKALRLDMVETVVKR